MAEVSDKALVKGVKLVSISDFRNAYAGGVSAQAIEYAIKHDLVDYLDVGARIKVIVLTTKSISYKPNSSPKRARMSL